MVQEIEAVGCWWTIEFGTVPEDRAAIQGCLHDFRGFIVWKLCGPVKTWRKCERLYDGS